MSADRSRSATLVDRALAAATRRGLRRGVAGSRPWIVAGIAAGGLRVLRRVARPRPEVIYRTVLRPGDAFEIRARRPE